MSVLQKRKIDNLHTVKSTKKVANKQNVCEFFVCEGFLLFILCIDGIKSA